jgi:hypothetical protein
VNGSDKEELDEDGWALATGIQKAYHEFEPGSHLDKLVEEEVSRSLRVPIVQWIPYALPDSRVSDPSAEAPLTPFASCQQEEQDEGPKKHGKGTNKQASRSILIDYLLCQLYSQGYKQWRGKCWKRKSTWDESRTSLYWEEVCDMDRFVYSTLAQAENAPQEVIKLFRVKDADWNLARYVCEAQLWEYSVAYKLKMNPGWRVHPVFRVSLLEPYREDGRVQPPPPPIEMEGTLEYEVESILEHRFRGTRA